MVEKIQLGDQWYILATSSPADERTRVLKYNDTFAMFDRFGDIQPIGLGEGGIYYGDTRFLSHHELLVDGVKPMYLNSAVKDNSSLLITELMNPDLRPTGKNIIPKGTLHIFRGVLLWDTSCYEHIRVVNYGLEEVEATVSLEFGADYMDIFQVRGVKKDKRGQNLSPETNDNELLFGYDGLDGVVRRTRVTFDPSPVKITANSVKFKVSLAPKGEAHIYATIGCELEGQEAPTRANPTDYFTTLQLANSTISKRVKDSCKIVTSNELFNHWVDRSTSDLAMLISSLTEGDYPYAGVPWYSTTFGRDGILTARECLWSDPNLAKGVLQFLAVTQATEEDPERDAEPGKILHEARKGELAAINEVPFRRYYGTVDATPLFIGLAGAYYERTGDLNFIRGIWPNIQRALEWIDRYGDLDGDGFIEYARRTDTGLENQGWKDSHDSIFHSDGQLAQAPIALCEVQGYVYEAKLRAAQLAELFDDGPLAKELRGAAAQLKKRFNEAFWCEEIGNYAIALDGEKRQCAVPSSNAGHTLWSEIATPERAAKVVEQLLSEEFFCGWGVRTIGYNARRYNPMAYHNGSVWPHDNALIAAGMAKYGYTDKAMKIFTGLFEATLFMDQYRMPELFCGFAQRPSEGPTLYPVACSPQAWSAACVFYLLQACLGLSFYQEKPEIRFKHPQLPPFLEVVEIKDLWVNGTTIDLLLERYPNNVGINVLRKDINVEVVVVA
jgi:glycogen debranching enzyme